MKSAAKVPAVVISLLVALLSAAPAAAQANGTPFPVPKDSDFPTPPSMSVPDPSQSFSKPYIPDPPAVPLIVFFPPGPPAYGEPLTGPGAAPVSFGPAPVPLVNGSLKEPPEGLGNYVNEFFYPALSTRLFSNDLDKKTAQRLEAYIAARTALVNELQDVLVALEPTDAETREKGLRAFAAEQTPRIVKQEASAEELRERIIHSQWHSSVDWNKDRKWKLGDASLKHGSYAAQGEFQVIRAAVYYQKGLLPEQRGLLWEIALEQRNQLFGHSVNVPVATNMFFFSPETSRPVFPRLTPGLSGKVAVYLHDKEVLKMELHDAVVANDQAYAGRRDEVFKKLAESQWPRLVALEESAEQIRREVAALPPPPAPPLPPQIPAELKARIEASLNEKKLLAQELAEHVKSVAAVPIFTGLSERRNAPLAIDEIKLRIAERDQAVARAADEFRKENAPRYEALEQKIKSAAADLIALAQTQIDPATGRPMDVTTLVRRIRASEQYFDRSAREDVLYKTYRIAVLQPGLSPEQRRLLFGAALVGLAQALPYGQPLAGSYLYPRS